MNDSLGNISNSAASNDQNRSSNVELLRIISMILISLHHFCLHSEFQWSSMTQGLFTIQCLSIGGKIGVSVFILVTGYFLVYKSISSKKVLRLYLQVFFYSISLYLIIALVFSHTMNGNDLRTALMPISNSNYWFATSYLTLYLFVPFLNIFIRTLSKKMLFCLICMCVGIWTIWYCITQCNPNYTDFLWLILLYLIGAYIRLYPPLRYTKCLPNLLCIIALILASFINLHALNSVKDSYYSNAAYFYNMDNIYVFFISLLLFLTFINIQIPYSKLINTVASASFGVYLISENPWFRPYLWKDILHSEKFQESPLLIPYAFGIVFLLFSVFTLIDLSRQYVLEKPIMKFVDKFGPVIAAPFIHIWNEIWRKIWVENTDSKTP